MRCPGHSTIQHSSLLISNLTAGAAPSSREQSDTSVLAPNPAFHCHLFSIGHSTTIDGVEHLNCALSRVVHRKAFECNEICCSCCQEDFGCFHVHEFLVQRHRGRCGEATCSHGSTGADEGGLTAAQHIAQHDFRPGPCAKKLPEMSPTLPMPLILHPHTDMCARQAS